MEQFLTEMIRALQQNRKLSGFDIGHSPSEKVCEYPLERPVVRLGRKKTEAGFLLGSENLLVEENVLEVTVLTDDKQGAAFCDHCAEEVCRAVLDEDVERRITSAYVEGAMYEKQSFAYKVIMSFRCRECAGQNR